MNKGARPVGRANGALEVQLHTTKLHERRGKLGHSVYRHAINLGNKRHVKSWVVDGSYSPADPNPPTSLPSAKHYKNNGKGPR